MQSPSSERGEPGGRTDPQLAGYHDEFLRLTRAGLDEGQSFFERELQERVAANYKLAQSEFPAESKYVKPEYKHRARFFRGKTESALRQNEAAAVTALFSTHDVVSIKAANEDDEQAAALAKALHRVVNVRLDNDVKWFLTAIGAYHETMIAGVLVSEQYWEREFDEQGQITINRPVVELHPPENVVVSPSANWLDPINSSPYVIIELPRFVGDIKDLMADGEWYTYTDEEIRSALPTRRNDEVRESRTGQTEGELDTSPITDFTVARIYKCYVRKDGVEYLYYTLGDRFLLTDPQPLDQAYPHTADPLARESGIRPLAWGRVTIEPHRTHSRGVVDRVKGTQLIANELVNQRIDNVRLVLNRRYFGLRGSNTDFRALVNNVAGSVILTDDMEGVKPEQVIDVTGSSYQEQTLLNADFDDLAGSFSAGTVQTNRQLNETVGGINMLKEGANALTEYQLRIWVETWYEPVVRQLVLMTKYYETDESIQEIVGPVITADMLRGTKVKTRVAVGFGSTDPIGKIQRLMLVINTLATANPQTGQRIVWDEVAKEAFGAIGYADGNRFLPPAQEDPQVVALLEQLQMLMQVIESKQLEHQQALELAQVNGLYRLMSEQARGEMTTNLTAAKTQADRATTLTKMALDERKDQRKQQLDLKKIDLDAIKNIASMVSAAVKERELSAKMSGQIEEGI
jgi:hypothetical protein